MIILFFDEIRSTKIHMKEAKFGFGLGCKHNVEKSLVLLNSKHGARAHQSMFCSFVSFTQFLFFINKIMTIKKQLLKVKVSCYSL